MKFLAIILFNFFLLGNHQIKDVAGKSKSHDGVSKTFGNSLSAISLLNLLDKDVKNQITNLDISDSIKYPVHAFCGTGDHLWVDEREPVDSRESVASMFEWMSQTYQIKRMYWRGGQEGIWQNHYEFGKATVQNYDYKEWADYVYGVQNVNEAAVAAAKKNGMEIFLYDGLFDHGIQPDVGIIAPHLFEDKLRIEHPEWIPLDRWGERRSPGPISFSYPEARKIIIDRYVNYVLKNGYDGINFYTYVENLGLRYLDEFGFDQPIIDEFNKRYPKIDLRKDKLTEEHKLYWYKCRGKFITDFIRELHNELAKNGKKLSMILDSKEPEYAQPWWGKMMPGTGMIYMDWETWVKEGIVDELWVQLGNVKDQQVVLNRLLEKCKGKPVKLTVRTPDPFASYWKKYVEAGVTPIAVITWAKNGIEKFSLKQTDLSTLKSSDWKLRLQTLEDIILGKIEADGHSIEHLAKDPNVLVRRKCMAALSKIEAIDYVSVVEEALFDEESSVRIAAVRALKTINRMQSFEKILDAVQKSPIFQFKNASSETFGSIGKEALPILLKGLNSDNVSVREVCVRGISNFLKAGGIFEDAWNPLLNVLNNSSEDYRVRWWTIKGLVGVRNQISALESERLVSDLNVIITKPGNASLQIQAARSIGDMSDYMSKSTQKISLSALTRMFKEYGDNSTREDAAFGWRIVGNAIKNFDNQGIDILEKMRKQTDDKWLAWVAYEVLYVEQKSTEENTGFNLVDEKVAIENHNKYAPVFPGWRKW